MINAPIFTSLGLFIIDENRYPKAWNRERETDIIGGGVSYAIVGGRIVSGPKLGRRICGIIDKGSDFPLQIEDEINSWGTGTVFRQDLSRLTTRGANIYREDGVREFRYFSPKKRIQTQDILDTANLISLKSFHFCCSIERCEETINVFTHEAEKAGRSKPIYIFEPFPEVCVEENFEKLKKMLCKVDVFSPNLHEAQALLGLPGELKSVDEIKHVASQFWEHCSPKSGVVLRCGELGSFLMTETMSIMLPAYHSDASQVVDVTGGGNTYCGAFVTALTLSSDWLIAGVMANLASGIIIERLGVPKLKCDLWNGTSVMNRLKIYISKNQELLKDFDVSKIYWM